MKKLTKLFFLICIVLNAFLIRNLYGSRNNKQFDTEVHNNDRQTKPKEVTTKQLYGAYQVKRVVDGDTFIVQNNGVETTVRLIGVDTPESVSLDVQRNTEEGKIAASFTKNLLNEKEVWLEKDKQEVDKYGRALAYAYLDQKGTDMIQERLLKAGMANCMRIVPNIKYENHFAKLQEQARDNNAGFWKYDFWNE